MTHFGKIIAMVIILVVGGFFLLNNFIYNEKQGEPLGENQDTEVIEALGKAFQERIFTAGTADGLIPIEGFDAGLLLGKFPGLVVWDFEGVETFEGVYSVEDGEAVYTRTKGQPISSAESTVSTKGYITLLKNVSARLKMPVMTEFEIDALVTQLYGKGTVKAGVGESLTASGVTVIPIEVTADSRCPSDVQCVWEGTTKVLTSLDGEEVELTLGEATKVGAHLVTLTQVLPYPEAGVAIEQNQYQLVFVVEEL